MLLNKAQQKRRCDFRVIKEQLFPILFHTKFGLTIRWPTVVSNHLPEETSLVDLVVRGGRIGKAKKLPVTR